MLGSGLKPTKESNGLAVYDALEALKKKLIVIIEKEATSKSQCQCRLSSDNISFHNTHFYMYTYINDHISKNVMKFQKL